ncbi:Integrase catalytic core [Trinorchestia longiramus]|nr:Integrase catalytic core [Trinorchestia longiramus]
MGNPTDPVEVWRKLQNTFQKKSWANKFRLKKKLFNMKLENGQNLQDHLKVCVKLFEELAIIGDPMEEEERVIILLSSLPDRFSTLVTALEVHEKIPAWEVVTERLLNEERRQRGGPGTSDSSEKLLVSFKRNKKLIKCFECGKEGHITRQCRVYEERLKKENRTFQANKAVDARSSSTGETIMFTSAFPIGNVDCDSWIVDSGATQHMCNKQSEFSSYSDLSSPVRVEIGDGRALKGNGVGDVRLKITLPDMQVKNCVVKNVLFVPELACNLISVPQIAECGKETHFNKSTCEIVDENNELIVAGHKVGRLYRLDCFYHVAAKCSSVSSDDRLWHKRFCHLGFDNLKKLKFLDLVRGFDCSVGNENIFCENCCDGKSHRLHFSRVDQRKVRKPLELIHSDVCGKINPSSLGGGSYFVTFIDDYSRYTWVYIIKNKSDVFGVFTEFKALVENHYDHKIKILRTDNGGEYVSTDFERFLKVNGIVHQKTVPKTLEQNGVAERMNRTILEAVRAMLSDSKLPNTFWAEAVSTAVCVKNRSPTSAHKNLTPYQALNGHKPNVQHFRTFGCMAYAHVPKDEREKHDSKSKTCVLLGDVVFNESQFISFEKEPSKEIECVPCSLPQEEKHEDSEGELELCHSTRNRAAPDRFGEWVCFAQDKFDVPANVEEALHGPESKLWKAAMEEEMASMNINNVWSLVERPKKKKPIRCKWIFKKKTGPDGNVCSYKARLVAQGYAQKFGVDYNETFSPVVAFCTKEIDLVHCPSNDMLADIFTKGLSTEKFSRLRSKLGVVSFEKHIQSEKEC